MKSIDNEIKERITVYSKNKELNETAISFMTISAREKYSYNFSWLGRPIIQYPQDMIAMQEIIWKVKPDLIIETGIAHGGSLIFYASLLALLDLCETEQERETLAPPPLKRKVLGIDIEIRSHNRVAIESHPLYNRIQMIEGSSTDQEVIKEVYRIANGFGNVLVCLDSMHTHDHVLAELKAYAPLVSPGSYCVIFDTIIDDLPADMYPDRPWGPGNNPKSAVHEYLRTLNDSTCFGTDGTPLLFEIDHSITQKLLITVAPDGYLKRVHFHK
ncbi:MAG: cephalosporin hydroxylase family protein [Syntrophales bacterium]|nr:cephalosporin hydroxylase family protein [Syntrophales bacterium]